MPSNFSTQRADEAVIQERTKGDRLVTEKRWKKFCGGFGKLLSNLAGSAWQA